MSELKGFRGTPGNYTYSAQDGPAGKCYMAQVWRPDNKCLACVEPTDPPEEASANARLLAKSYELALFVQKFVGADIIGYDAGDDAMIESLKEDARALLASVIGE